MAKSVPDATLRAILVAAVGAAMLVAACSRPNSPASGSASEGALSREAALTVTVVEVVPVELPRTISLNGTIHAWQEVIIAPEVGGYRVAEVYVDVGDRVARGDLLVELSTALLKAEVANKEAALKQRDAAHLNAEAAFERARELSGRQLVSQAELDRLESEALVASAAVEAARADLQTSQLRLRFARVTAPDDGVITSRTVTVGQIAQAGAEMLRLLREGRIEWRGDVPEMRLAEVHAGQTVTITAVDGSRFTGTIRVVAPTVSNATRTGLVYVDLPADQRLRPGMFARGDIQTGRGPALTVPLESVVSADGYSYVFMLGADDVVQRRRIETGIVHGTDIEVVSGLGAGESVVVEGAGFLKDGDRVNVAADGGS